MPGNRNRGGDSQHAKKTVSIILSFLIFVFSTIIAMLSCLYLNIFDAQSMINALSSSGYYASVCSQFETNAWDISIPLGIPEEVVLGLADEDKVTSDIKESLRNSIENQEYVVDTVPITNALDSRVKAYFAEKGTVLNEEQLAVLEEYKKDVAGEYVKLTSLPLVKYIGAVKTAYFNMIMMILAACAVLDIASFVILIKMHRFKHRGIRYGTYASIASALSMAAIPVFCYATSVHKKLNVSPAYFKGFVTAYIENILFYMVMCAVLFVLIAVMFSAATWMMKRKLKRHRPSKIRN